MLARTGRLTAVRDALVAEGEACLAALRAATELGISRIIPETDSKNLVQAITTCDFDQAPGGVIFREIKEMLSLHFNPDRIVFSTRSCKKRLFGLSCLGLSRLISTYFSLTKYYSFYRPYTIYAVSRTDSKCAHELAHFGLARDPDQPIVWLDPLPRFVRSLLDCDAADPESGV